MDQQGEMLVFVRVLQYESFTATAWVFKLTPLAVGKIIGRIEGRFNAPLLNRTTRRLYLTEEGWAFYKCCVPIYLLSMKLKWLLQNCERNHAVF